MRAGIVYQIKGPFVAGANVLNNFLKKNGSTGENMKIGISIDSKDLMTYGDLTKYPRGFDFIISGPAGETVLQMGRSGMYQTDTPLWVSELSFPHGAPESVIVDFVIY